MKPNYPKKIYLDPIEELDDALNYAWRTLCYYYDASGELPDIRELFSGTDVINPHETAEIVVTNMLTDVVSNIGRFSPWYTKPARAFGLSALRDVKTKEVRWVLAPEAIQKWEELVRKLAVLIRQNSGLIQAMLYVENLIAGAATQDKCVAAQCDCLPSQVIRVNKSIIEKRQIYCNVCKQPFA